MYNVTQENICPPYSDNEYLISAKCHDREEYTTPGSTERKRSVRAFVTLQEFVLLKHAMPSARARFHDDLHHVVLLLHRACSGLSPARARPWRANETCAARRTFLRTPERLINLSGVLSYFLCLLTRYWQFSILYNIFQVHPHP